MLRNSIKEDLKENFISEEEYWQYNKEYSDKIKNNDNNVHHFDDLIISYFFIFVKRKAIFYYLLANS